MQTVSESLSAGRNIIISSFQIPTKRITLLTASTNDFVVAARNDINTSDRICLVIPKIMKNASKSLILLLLSFGCHHTKIESPKYILWYDSPAVEWTDALPVGNGRIGGMLFGNTKVERLQVNEESLWGGSKIPNDNPGALEHLPEIRQLILDGKIPRAFELAEKYIAGIPGKLRSYQVLGDIYFQFLDSASGISNYRRELNLETGILRVSYSRGENKVEYEVFASSPDDVIVMKMKSSASGPLDMAITMKRQQDASFVVEDNALVMKGQVMDGDDPALGPGGPHMRFYSKLLPVRYDGTISSKGDTLLISGCKEIVLLFDAATDYSVKGLNFDRNIDPEKKCNKTLSIAADKSYNTLKIAHLSEHKALFDRVSFTLTPDPLLDTLPTNQRLERFKTGAEDQGLITTYFQYGRYLLMGSSRRPAQLPANLQGIWNKDWWAPWGSDYHVNINLEMNYWPAEVCNLSETVEPLIDFMEEITVPGAVTAKKVYGAKGWTLHHTTDVFGKTSVIDGVYWGMFPLGGAWMTLPIWNHFEFTNDTIYLRERAYPMMKGASRFIQTFLFEDKEGYLVTAPTYSPENSYIDPVSGKEFKLTYAPTMDIQIIREVLTNTQKAAAILHIDKEFSDSLQLILDKLPPVRIASNGTIMEWIKEYKEFEPGHRHISHLFGLHPGTQITPETPEFFEAARKTLERRLEYGGGHTGWSRAWIINFYARLLDGEECYKHLRLLLEKSTLPNLFDTHPPFQIDGNFGGTAGIAEMLLQSQNGVVHILPALPSAWPQGSIKGLKARGNFEVNIKWNEGNLSELKIRSIDGAPLTIAYRDKKIQLDTQKNELLVFDGQLNRVE
jgi:alpha-L-fucosidase 2